MIKILRIQSQGRNTLFYLHLSRSVSSQSHTNSLNPFRKYVFSSYVEYIKNYENKLEARFPAAIRVYRIFKVGFQDFYQDLKLFINLRRKLAANQRDLQCLTRKELELNQRMPVDMLRVAPVLLISALPFANYIVFPLAYIFPKQLLSRHFWTLQQRVQFAVLDQRNKLKHFKPVFRALQQKMSVLKSHPLYPPWRQCIAQLGSGLHPNSEKIFRSQTLFSEGETYDIKKLTSGHIQSLLKMHNMHLGWRRRHRLVERAKLIVLMDRAILKEGGVGSLTHDEVRSACFLRCLNPTNMNSDETIIWLNDWIQLSTRMRSDNWSYILHLPILMAYNHPSNWVLIH